MFSRLTGNKKAGKADESSETRSSAATPSGYATIRGSPTRDKATVLAPPPTLSVPPSSPTASSASLGSSSSSTSPINVKSAARVSNDGASSPSSGLPSLNGSWSRVDVSAYSTMRRTSSSLAVGKVSSSPAPSTSPREHAGSSSQPLPIVPPLTLRKSGSPSPGTSPSSPTYSPVSPTKPLQMSQRSLASPHSATSSASELARRALNTSSDMAAVSNQQSGSFIIGGRAGLASSSSSTASSAALGSSSGYGGWMTLRGSKSRLDTGLERSGCNEYHTIDDLRVRKLAVDHLHNTPHINSSVRLFSLLVKNQGRWFKVNEHDRVNDALYSLFEHIQNNGLAVEDLFAFQIAKAKVEPLYNLVIHKGMSLSEDTNAHIVGELLRLALERLPRKPFNFEQYEPDHSFIGLEGNEVAQVKLIEETLRRIDPGERQIIGLTAGLVSQLVSMAEVNSANEDLLFHLFAPLLVDGRWLSYCRPPTVKLDTPLVI